MADKARIAKMKQVSTALKLHLALPSQTMATCWRAVLENGSTYGFTDHDANLVVSGWSGADTVLHGTYLAGSGFNASSIATSDALNVDNTDAHGVLVSPAITDADLRAGLWDFARIYIFQVNWNDLTMGPLYQRVGWLGEVTTGRTTFKAELRGLMQLYTRTLVELTSPMCRANLGDVRCKVDLVNDSPPFTAGASVDSVNADNQTFYSAALTAAGPSTGVAITGVSNANPGVVTLANDSLHLVEGQAVTISGVLGMEVINTVTIARNPTATTFELRIDTSDTGDYPPYTSGGTVTPLGGGSGYYQFGIVTWLTGLNAGLSMEVKSYVPGQVTLALPMPYAISDGSPIDTFTISAGCDKSMTTCRDRFNNIVNFRGEPYLPGIDKIIQVGRHT
jgi:uncharacterized phage protein (TIGR02218 family)